MTLFRKTRISTLINIVGMSIAFAAAIILTVQVKWDVTYDDNFDESEKVFRLENSLMGDGLFSTWISRPLIETIRTASPNIEAVGTFSSLGQMVYYKEGHKDSGVSVSVVRIDSTMLSVFPFEWLEGSAANFTTKGTAIISEDWAQKIFANESAIDKIIEDSEGNPVRIIGVFRNTPLNFSMHHDMLEFIGSESIDNQHEFSYNSFIKLRDASQAEQTETMIEDAFLKFYGADDNDTWQVKMRECVRICNLHDAHFERDVRANVMSANKSVIITLTVMAIFLILIAIINFINFAFAEIPFHIKNINTRRVLGESRNSLIGKQLRKAALTALVAFGIAILVVHLVASSSLASYVSGSLNVADNVGIIAFMLAIVVVAAIVAGIAPAIYSTSQPTTMVLKGSYAMSVKGKALRNVLVGLQYVLSFGFILMALFVHIQTKYMIHSDMGFTQANVLQIYCGYNAGGDHEAVTAKLLQNPAIADVTFADGNLVSDQKMGWSRDDENGDNIYMEVFPVDVNFVKFFGLNIVDGRDFSESDNQSDAGCFIVNENFIQTFPQFEVGKLLNAHTENPAEIIGVMKDFNFKSLQHPMEPLVLFNWGKNCWRPFRVMYVKTVAGADYEAVSQYIKETVNAFDPTMPISQIDVHHLDQWIEDMYQSEEKHGNLITIASLVALIIAIIGIIGLVFFETQFLRREIAIRRVNGATVDSILRMINRKYIFMAVASFVVATPLTYMVITTWRREFAYQAPVSAWIFAVAFALVVAITVAVVTLQSWRTANSNPVNALKEN